MINQEILQACELLDVAAFAMQRASVALRNLPDHNEYVLQLLEKVYDVNATIRMDLHHSTEDILAGIAKIKEAK